MVAIDTTRSAAPQVAYRFISAIYNVTELFSSWNSARITRTELSRLTARELDDIGLCYGDIEDIAMQAYRR